MRRFARFGNGVRAGCERGQRERTNAEVAARMAWVILKGRLGVTRRV